MSTALSCFFFFNDTATTEIYTLSLHDALPIFDPERDQPQHRGEAEHRVVVRQLRGAELEGEPALRLERDVDTRSEEHTSELQSRQYLVCRLLLEKKKKNNRGLTHSGDPISQYR